MPLVFIFFFKFSGTFSFFLDPSEILLNYPNTDSSHWFREDFQRILYKYFVEQLMI